MTERTINSTARPREGIHARTSTNRARFKLTLTTRPLQCDSPTRVLWIRRALFSIAIAVATDAKPFCEIVSQTAYGLICSNLGGAQSAPKPRMEKA